MPEKKVLTTFEAAALCNVSYNTIKNWIKRGLLDAYRTAGGHLRIKLQDLEGFSSEYGVPILGSENSNRRKVLIVDDGNFISDFSESFEHHREKIEVKTARDAFETGTMLETMKPDLVILNSGADDMDGFKICSYIRKSSSLRHAKVVLITEQSGGDLQGDRIACDLKLTKPIDRVGLVESIEPFLMPKKGVRGRKRKGY